MVARKRTPKPAAPVPVVVKKIDWPSWISCAVVVSIGVAFFWPKLSGGGDRPKPTPAVAVDKLTAEAFQVMAAEYEKFHVDAARSIKAGDIKTDAELYAALKPGREAALRKAFTPIDDYVEAGLQRDNHILKPESAEFLETLGKAFGKAVK